MAIRPNMPTPLLPLPRYCENRVDGRVYSRKGQIVVWDATKNRLCCVHLRQRARCCECDPRAWREFCKTKLQRENAVAKRS